MKRILIFDEATSSLDSITERSRTDTIKEIARSRPNLITVMVAHRLSTISLANRVILIDAGRVVATGTHAAAALAAHNPTALLEDLSDADAFWKIVGA